VAWGALADFHVLDDRQYRSHQVCTPPGRGGSSVVEDCAARLDPRLTILGEVQEQWLLGSLGRSRARWNVIAQQTLMAQLDREPGPGQAFWTDGWDGYPAARRRLLDFLAQKTPANPLVIGGDVQLLGRRPQGGLRRRALAVRGHRVRRDVDHLAAQPLAGGADRAADREPAHPVRGPDPARLSCAWR
jgi:hypothetical protein